MTYQTQDYSFLYNMDEKPYKVIHRGDHKLIMLAICQDINSQSLMVAENAI